MSLISIVVPIYKTEKYLNRCIQSLLCQNIQDIELILINDGSPDGCGGICEQYKKQDSRITVIHQENAGLSAARNTGIKVANSPYIGFVDSDDWVHPNMYKTLYEDLMSYDAQISVCDMQRVFEGSIPLKVDASSTKIKKMTGMEALENILISASTGGHTACNKLYRKHLFDGNEFPVGKLYEDAATIYKLYFQCTCVVYRNSSYYYYLQRKESIMARVFDLHSMDKIYIADEIVNFTEKNCPALKSQAECFRIISALRLMADILNSEKGLYPFEYEKIRRILLLAAANPYLSFRHKLLVQLYRISPRLYSKFWNMRLKLRI